MANTTFLNLSDRAKSKIISEVFLLTKKFSQLYSYKERAYLSKLAKLDPSSIAWKLDETGCVGATLIIDPYHIVDIKGAKIQLVGHILSNHKTDIKSLVARKIDEKNKDSLAFFCTSEIGQVLNLEEKGFVEIDYKDLEIQWDCFAKTKTHYFNVNETISQALSRKKMSVFLKLNTSDFKILESQKALPVFYQTQEIYKAFNF